MEINSRDEQQQLGDFDDSLFLGAAADDVETTVASSCLNYASTTNYFFQDHPFIGNIEMINNISTTSVSGNCIWDQLLPITSSTSADNYNMQRYKIPGPCY